MEGLSGRAVIGHFVFPWHRFGKFPIYIVVFHVLAKDLGGKMVREWPALSSS